MKRLFLVTAITLLTTDGFAGGGWIRKKNSLYFKTAFSRLATDRFYTSTGQKISTADFTTWSLDAYAEYGIVERWDAIVRFPVYKRSSFETTTSASGIGDLAVEFRYGLSTGRWPVALGIGVDLPTGDNRLSAQVKNDPGATIFLPTGDGEWNYRFNFYVSHGFETSPLYVSLDGGYNLRTMGFTDEYTIGLQAGYQPLRAIGVQVFARRLAPIGDVDSSTPSSRIGIGEGVQYTSLGGGLSYEFAPGYTLSADFFSAVGKITNIYSGANFVIGLSFEK
jgi:hypothetical protein